MTWGVEGRGDPMGLLGEDGDGYELAVRLENSAAWKDWLGAASYAKLLPHLSSPAAWHSFMNSSALLTLQMRVRALLFDKAAGCLFIDNSNSFDTISPSSLHSSFQNCLSRMGHYRICLEEVPMIQESIMSNKPYSREFMFLDLQLDANGVYFPLDQDAEDWRRVRGEGSLVVANPLAKHGCEPLNGSTSAEDGQEIRGAVVTVQQRCPSQGGQYYSNLLSSKQEGSRPSLNKVKKVEAWENFTAKRPMELVGTINKKLRSPKISSKTSFQADAAANLSIRDHHLDKMSHNKSPPGSLLVLEEPKYSAIGAGRTGHTESSEDGGLWYDRYLEKHLKDRMQRVAHRSAQQKLPFKDQEACVRTAEGMGAYLERFSCLKGKSPLVKNNTDLNTGVANYSIHKFAAEEGNKVKDDSLPLLEFKFLGNCVPDSSVPLKRRRLNNSYTGGTGLLDQLESNEGNPTTAIGVHHQHQPLRRSGRRGTETDSEPTGRHQGVTLSGSSKSPQSVSKLQEHEAQQMMQQTVAKMVAAAGFEGLKQTSMDILCDLLGRHIRKLGSGLRSFVDNYRKRCSQTELLQMYLQSTGSSVDDLMELVKSGMQVEIPVATQVAPQVSNQKRQTGSTQSSAQQVSSRQAVGLLSPVQQAQHAFSDKNLKRRQPSNLGRSKKVEKDRQSSDGKSVGEARSDLSRSAREMRQMQISPVGSRLNPQQSPWHPQMPLVQSQTGPGMQSLKQQLSSLQQLPSLQQ